jgi:small subunit ribosomal protein S8
MITDPIANFLTIIRNGIIAGHRVVEVSASNTKENITRILKDQGYIHNYKVEGEGAKKTIKIALKYDNVTKINAIREIKRVSRPGLRRYSSSSDLPRVKNGLGIAIVSTSKGVMTDKDARRENVGGEVLCYVS